MHKIRIEGEEVDEGVSLEAIPFNQWFYGTNVDWNAKPTLCCCFKDETGDRRLLWFHNDGTLGGYFDAEKYAKIYRYQPVDVELVVKKGRA